MNTTKWFLILGIILLFAGVGAALRYHQEDPIANSSGSSPNSRAGGVRGGSPRESAEGVVCSGYVDLEHGIRSLAPLHPGRVVEVVAKDNQHVEAGALILRLEDQDARLQVEAAETAVTMAEVQLEEALKGKEQQRARLAQQQAVKQAVIIRLDAARQTLRRKEEQRKDNLILSEDLITTRAEVKALEQQEQAEGEKFAELKTVDPALAVRKAKAQLKLVQIQRDQARRQLDECTLKAPTAGTVQQISLGAGDIVTGNLTQPIVRFAPDESPLIRAEVDQEFADRVQVGQTALIRDDTHTGASWHGRVQHIAGWYHQRRPTALDPSAFTDVRTVECLITIDPGQPPLRLGQRMRVMIGRVPLTAGE